MDQKPSSKSLALLGTPVVEAAPGYVPEDDDARSLRRQRMLQELVAMGIEIARSIVRNAEHRPLTAESVRSFCRNADEVRKTIALEATLAEHDLKRRSRNARVPDAERPPAIEMEVRRRPALASETGSAEPAAESRRIAEPGPAPWDEASPLRPGSKVVHRMCA